jgi:hypothetical protein
VRVYRFPSQFYQANTGILGRGCNSKYDVYCEESLMLSVLFYASARAVGFVAVPHEPDEPSA